MGKLTDKVARGVFWVLLEKFGIQAAHFVVTLVLARLLTPNDYGTVALLSVFVSISNVFVDCGFGKALVQKKGATQTDYNTVFYLSMAFAAVLYTGLFFAAPLVASFYGIPDLAIMLRVLALSLIFHSINGVQNVELNRKMLFHLSFRISWVRTIVSAVTGISFALAGYGSWALVWASLAGGIVGVIARQLVIRWRPSCTFSWDSAKGLFRFGWKMTIVALIDKVYSNLQGLLIGKIYTRADLAFVNKGRHVPNLFKDLVSVTLTRVSFSALSRMQSDPDRLRNAMRRMITSSTFFVFPMMLVLGILAEPLVLLMFGPRWLQAVPYLQLTCVGCALRPIDAVNMQAILARGRSDIYMKLMIFRRILGLVILASTIRLGVFTFVAVSVFTVVPLGVIMNMWPNRRHLGYRIGMQVSDVWSSFLLSVLVGAALWASTLLPFGKFVLLVPQITFAFCLYLGMAIVFRVRPAIETAKALQPLAEKKYGAESKVATWLRRFVREGG